MGLPRFTDLVKQFGHTQVALPEVQVSPVVEGEKLPAPIPTPKVQESPIANVQKLVAENYRDREAWVRKSIFNTACSGYFSTDRTMQEYNNDIWKL